MRKGYKDLIYILRFLFNIFCIKVFILLVVSLVVCGLYFVMLLFVKLISRIVGIFLVLMLKNSEMRLLFFSFVSIRIKRIFFLKFLVIVEKFSWIFWKEFVFLFVKSRTCFFTFLLKILGVF